MNKTSFPILSPDLIIILFFLCHSMLSLLRPVSNLLKSSWFFFKKSLWFQSLTISPSFLGPKKHPSCGTRSLEGSHCSRVVGPDMSWPCPDVAVSGNAPARLAVSSPRFLPPHTALPSHTGSQGLSKSYLKSGLTELSSGIFAECTELFAWDVPKHSLDMGAQSLLLLNSIAFLPAASLVLQQLSLHHILPLTSVATYDVKPVINDI